MFRKRKKLFVVLVRWAIILLILFFIFRTLWANIDQLREFEFELKPIPILISYLLLLIYYFGRSISWHYITIKNKVNIPLHLSILAWFYSLIGKYLPGKIFLLLGRLYFYQNKGQSKTKVAFCFFLETLCTLLASTFTVLISLMFIEVDNIGIYRSLLLVLIVLLLIVLYPPFLNVLINFVMKLLNKNEVQLQVVYFDMYKFVGIYTINWFVFGAAFFFFINSIIYVDLQYFIYLTGAISFASLIGVLALFAPSGIGVREGVLVFMLKMILPISIAILVSLTARIWVTIGEIAFVSVAFLVAKLFDRKTKISLSE